MKEINPDDDWHAGISARIANEFANAYDMQAKALLERNNIKWTGNIEDMKKQLEAKGYRLEVDVQRETIATKTIYTFYLTKIIDRQFMAMEFNIEPLKETE